MAADAAPDLIVVGAGTAGLTTAVFAADQGLRVTVLESTGHVGGTSARSAGAIWVPNTAVGAAANPDDTPEAAAEYLRHVTGNAGDPAMRAAFLEAGPAAIAWLHERTEVRLRAFPHHPDYQSELPGATVSGRVMEAEPFDGRLLGRHFALVRPPLPEFTLLGGMMVDRRDITRLLTATRSPASALYAATLVARYARDRLRYPRGTRLVMGNALIGRLLLAALRRGVDIRTETRVSSLDREGGRVAGVTLETGEALHAPRGVVLATGGLSRHPTRRRDLIPDAAAFSPTAPGSTGAMIDLALGLGARLGEGNTAEAFWTPVSVRTRADGSEAVFPHFVLDRAKPGTVVVNRAGRRFLDESVSYHRFGARMLELDPADPCIPAFLIADRRAFLAYGLGIARPGGLGRRRLLADGYLVEASSLAALAGRLGIPGEALEATVARMNRFAETGKDEDFGRGETAYARNLGDPAVGPNPCLGPIVEPPFTALRLYPGDIGTVTGLVTDPDARVLADDGPIPGLYAVGNDMNSIFAGSYPGPGITLGPAVVFAWRAARAILS